jgi:hypothetical protein
MSGLFWCSKEEHMPSSKRAGIIGACQPDVWLLESPSKPALRAGIWARLLAALHESRKKEAARVIFRHRELIGNFRSIELLRSQDGLSADA